MQSAIHTRLDTLAVIRESVDENRQGAAAAATIHN